MNGSEVPPVVLTRPIKVVLASRDRVFAVSLARRLRCNGFEVEECEPGPGSETSAEAFVSCDVLVVETDGPSASDREVVARVRALSPLVEVVTISNKTAVPDAVRAFRSGLFAVLEHPLDNVQLMTTLREACGRKRRAEARIRELDRMAGRSGPSNCEED